MENTHTVLVSVVFDDSYVLANRNADMLPVEMLVRAVKGQYPEADLKGQTLSECRFEFTGDSFSQWQVRLWELLRIMEIDSADVKVEYVLDEGEIRAAEALIGNGEADEDEDGPAREEAEPTPPPPAPARKGWKLPGRASAEPAADALSAEACMNQLIGADALKALSDELGQLAPRILRRGTEPVLAARCYLFSVGSGCGLTTYLQLLTERIDQLGLFAFRGTPKFSEEADPGSIHARPRLICFDISGWMGRLGTAEFRRFLLDVSRYQPEHMLAFRIPFVDEATRHDVLRLLSDVFSVQDVPFPPFSMEQLRQYAGTLFDKYGFAVEEAAMVTFDERVVAEKSDGSFFGLRTVKKIVDEMIYQKHRADAVLAAEGEAETRISSADVAALAVAAEAGTALEQLDALVGIGPVKARLLEIVAQIELAKLSPGTDRPALHMQFLGGPGTGKTTVARILGSLLKERGLLSRGLFFEYAGRDLCGQYVGETAPKTAAICRDAYGSVLFIDEAYSLYRGNDRSNDYGREAIDTLIAQMENHRDDLLVIFAGYTDDMATLMQANVGLQSRIPYAIEFPNYSGPQLFDIFMAMVEGRFECEPAFREAARGYFEAMPEAMLLSREFSNARFVRNLFERTWGKAAARRQLDPETPLVLLECDFDKAVGEREFVLLQQRKVNRIGF